MSVLILVLILLLFAEVFSYRGIQFLLKEKSKPVRLIANGLYWLWTIVITGLIVYTIVNRGQMSQPKYMNFTFIVVGLGLMNFIAKVIFSSFHFLNEATWFTYRQLNNKQPLQQAEQQTMSRSTFLTKTGLALASIPFGGLLYGMVSGRFQFRVVQQTIQLANLPKSFEGMKIIHLSDMHLGSFPLHTTAIEQAVEMVNQLEADYILFTGDMINERAIEAEPWVETIGKMKAKYGKFSSLGNHDYGSYYAPWNGNWDKYEQNIQHLAQLQAKMGFKLLRNQHVALTHKGKSIYLIGLENWGKGFVQTGNLSKATKGIENDSVQILMSHDPTHWDAEVLEKTTIDLSLAGHTHGAQMGVEIPALNIKISPVSLRYKRWGGLYTEGKQQLYVNRGFGYIGYAGRVGMNPEITLFTLKKA